MRCEIQEAKKPYRLQGLLDRLWPDLHEFFNIRHSLSIMDRCRRLLSMKLFDVLEPGVEGLGVLSEGIRL
jgi:hypothetical protein